MSLAAQDLRNTRLEARVSPVQKALFQRAAALTGRTLSDLVVYSTQEAASRIVREHDVIGLAQEDQRTFVTTLLNPPPIQSRLQQAAKQYARAVEVEI